MTTSASVALRQQSGSVPGGAHRLQGPAADIIRFEATGKGFWSGNVLVTSLPVPTGSLLTSVAWDLWGDGIHHADPLTLTVRDLAPQGGGPADDVFSAQPTVDGRTRVTYTPPAPVPAAQVARWISLVANTADTLLLRSVATSWTRPDTAVSPVPPTRVYDSRAGGGKLDPDVDRVIPVGGSPEVVPAGASAVVITLTVTGTEGAGGYVAAFGGDDTYAGTSSVNWFGPGQNLAATVLLPLGAARTIKVRAGVARTDVVVDVTGYLV